MSVPLTPLAHDFMLCRTKNNFAMWCRPVVEMHISDNDIFGIEHVGYKCVFQRAESAVKDKGNIEWDLYPCIQVAFYHPVTKGWEAMCPFLWC